MIPEEKLIAVLIQLRDPHTVPVRRGLLRDGVHAHLGEIQVCADAHRGGDPGFLQHSPDDGHGHDMRRVYALTGGFRGVMREIGSGVDEGLVHGIDVDIAGSGITQDDGIDLGRDLLIERHARDRRDVGYPGAVRPFIIPDRSLRLKEPGTAGNPDGLEGRGYGQADRGIAALIIRHQEIGGQRIEAAGDAFTAGIETTSCRWRYNNPRHLPPFLGKR